MKYRIDFGDAKTTTKTLPISTIANAQELTDLVATQLHKATTHAVLHVLLPSDEGLLALDIFEWQNCGNLIGRRLI